MAAAFGNTGRTRPPTAPIGPGPEGDCFRNPVAARPGYRRALRMPAPIPDANGPGRDSSVWRRETRHPHQRGTGTIARPPAAPSIPRPHRSRTRLDPEPASHPLPAGPATERADPGKKCAPGSKIPLGVCEPVVQSPSARRRNPGSGAREKSDTHSGRKELIRAAPFLHILNPSRRELQ